MHRCPPRCHPCPILRIAIIRAGREPVRGEDVMPHCYGTINSDCWNWTLACVCAGPSKLIAPTVSDPLRRFYAYLGTRLANERNGRTSHDND